jgi:N-acetylmuramoyl-L-alanine amidase
MTPKRNSPARRPARGGARQTFLALLAFAVGIGALLAGGQDGPNLSAWLSGLTQGRVAATVGKRAGIVAGHWGSDPGAVCADGLTEAQVNLAIAQRVAARLRRAGAQVDLLQEFDPRLAGYQADVFVSIHADSCEVHLSGFKVARVAQSAVPAAEDRLVECLWRRYEQATALPRHENTITYDMREYHAFHEIAPQTPAAIIEVGFLGGDRRLLEREPDRVAQGIASAIFCFWSQEP